MSQERQYKYFAFISYNSKDTEWGKRVQRKLEGYRMPSTLCSEHGWKRKPLKPVFFAPTDIQPGGLTAELQERLRASRNLIVICSPNSARSKWVGAEIAYFHSLGRTENIHFFIVDGVPHSGNEDTECFNPVVETLGLPEILGANIHEKVSPWPWINKERAYVQLITKLLGVEFDSIWQRHKRLLVEKCIRCVLSSLFILLLTCWLCVPVKITFNLHDENHRLPPIQEGILWFHGGEFHFTSLDTTICVGMIPGYYRGQSIEFKIKTNCRYDSIRNEIPISYGTLQNIDVEMHRNEEFALYYGKIIDEDENPIVNAFIAIEGETCITDTSGRYSIRFPLSQQTEFKNLRISHSDYLDRFIERVSPGENCFIMEK